MTEVRAETPTARGMSAERRAELWRMYQTYDLNARKVAWDNFERWRAMPIEQRRAVQGPKPPVCISCGRVPVGRYNDYSPRFSCGPHPVVIAR